MRKYKDLRHQEIYEKLTSLGSPTALINADVFGSALSAFTMGFENLSWPKFYVRGSIAWIAYYAGRDSRPKRG